MFNILQANLKQSIAAMVSSYLPLIISNILRNRRRTAFTVASIALSICLIGLLFALTRALFFGEDSTPEQAKRIVVHHKIALTQDLPIGYEQTIKTIRYLDKGLLLPEGQISLDWSAAVIPRPSGTIPAAQVQAR